MLYKYLGDKLARQNETVEKPECYGLATVCACDRCKAYMDHIYSLPTFPVPSPGNLQAGDVFEGEEQKQAFLNGEWIECDQFVFDLGEREFRRLIIIPSVGEKGEVKRDYSKFFTYPETAKYMARLLYAKTGDKILEPSAGNGALVKAVKEHSGEAVLMYACELQEQHAEALRGICHWWVIADWLSDEISEDWISFDGCIANPPFGNGVDLKAHIDKIKRLVKEGGKIVIIVPADFNPECVHTVHPLSNWSKNKDGSVTDIKIIEFTNGSADPPQPSGGNEAVDAIAVKGVVTNCWIAINEDDIFYDSAPMSKERFFEQATAMVQGAISMTKLYARSAFAASRQGPVWVRAIDRYPDEKWYGVFRIDGDSFTSGNYLMIKQFIDQEYDLLDIEWLSDPGPLCECGKLRGVMETVLQNLSGWEDTDTMMGIAIKNITTALSPNQNKEGEV